MEKKTLEILQRKLPEWAVKNHPTKQGMSAIHPMAVIDQLNDAFEVGEWSFTTDFIMCNPFIQKTKNGDRNMFMSAVKGILKVQKYGIHIEQYGGSSNDDMGDALKGGGTDALTKCASYLGVGASIYKGQGNVEPPHEWTLEESLHHVAQSTDTNDLSKRYRELSATMQKDNEVIAKCTEIKKQLTS